MRNCQSSSPEEQRSRDNDQKASGDLHQDLLDDGGVCDGQPWRGHVVEPVDLAIHPVTLHVQLREIDLNNHY